MPKDIGTFDVSVMGAILLHLANPFAALTQIARLTNKTMIITDLYLARLWSPFGGALMEVNPHRGKCGPMAWWRISPRAVANMLHANGFEVKSLTVEKYKSHEMVLPECRSSLLSLPSEFEATESSPARPASVRSLVPSRNPSAPSLATETVPSK
jgi:hypothetical protein